MSANLHFSGQKMSRLSAENFAFDVDMPLSFNELKDGGFNAFAFARFALLLLLCYIIHPIYMLLPAYCILFDGRDAKLVL